MIASPKSAARLFIGIPVPDKAQRLLSSAVDEYSEYIARQVNTANRHITLAWLGEVRNHEQYMPALKEALPQPFLPTASVTHAGRGLKINQLWAYVHRTQNLNNTREQLVKRLKAINFPLPKDIDHKFVPHITLAHFTPISKNIVMADYPVNTTWSIKEAIIYRSLSSSGGAQYEPQGSIPFIK